MLRQLIFAFTILPSLALANDQLIGVWQNVEDDIRLDILDGFKPNRGAVLSIENGKNTRIGSWEATEPVTKMKLGWRSGEVRFRGSNSFEWENKIFHRTKNIIEDDVVLLKQGQNEFVDRMSKSVWLTSTKGEQAIFKPTFSVDSGVIELYTSGGELKGLETWGISSGVLKIDDNVIVEARISKDYLIGQDHRDKFVVFLAMQDRTPQGRIELAKQRENFLSELLTDTWQQASYGGYNYFKFRNVEGPLKGRVLRSNNDSFEGAVKWEYSPSTGALKIGYTDYIGALVVGDTLALLKKNGEQVFYQQRSDGPGKIFSMSDVRQHRVNETKISDLRTVLDGQFQLDDYLYSFEFGGDGRTGYVHKWKSVPFTVVGQKLVNEILSNSEVIYSLEDYLIFDERFALKRDATASRLRPKTNAEVGQDQKSMQNILDKLGQSSVVLRVTDLEGSIQDFTLPYASMSDIAGIQVITRQ